MKVGDGILILWHDAVTDDGWRPGDEKEAPVEVATVGFLVHRDRQSITVAATATEDGQTNSRITIPRSWIQDTVGLGVEAASLKGNR